MKTKQWIGTLFLFLLLLSGCVNNRGTVERPAVIARNTATLEIDKIERSDTATVLYIKAFYPAGQWIRIDPKSFLTDDQGNRYTIQSAAGIELGKEFYMPDSGKTAFTMTFPAVTPNATYIDFSEGDYKGAWKLWGIQLTNKSIKTNLPSGFKDVAIDKTAGLPPVEFKTGKARLEGRILNYRPGMPAEVTVNVDYPFEYPHVPITLPVDEKGAFSGEIDAYFAHPAGIQWLNCQTQCFIAPGETTLLVLNPAEATRRESPLLKDKPSLGEPVYYGGYLASISKELAHAESKFSLQHYTDYDSFHAFLKTIGNKTPEELKAFFLNEHNSKKAVLDTLNFSPAGKQIMQSTLELYCINDILRIPSWIDQAYVYNNQLQADREAKIKYYDTRKINIPDDFYNVIKDFSSLNDPQIVYTDRTAECVYQWQMNQMQPVLSKALGTDQGVIFDFMKVMSLNDNIKNFKLVDEAQIEQLPAGYQVFIQNKNKELQQLIEANKNKTGFTEHDIEKVADKDVIPFIISKFRGKPILIDIWATWCGPCKFANEEMKPLKKELENKGIVYVYVAGENSPLETWKNMIPDLHGEHFRLTAKQWETVGKTFSIEGVPTYFFIDRAGNIKEKVTGYSGIQPMKEKLLQLLKD